MSEIDLSSRIFDELIFIKSELNKIKEHMVDVDSIISEEERQLVRESLIHEKEGKLISLTDFKKQQGYDMFEILLDVPAQKFLKKNQSWEVSNSLQSRLYKSPHT
jgi:hypothetical protein